jgi:translation initiation factor 1
VTSKGNARLIYSTDTAGKCAVCGWPQRNCQCSSTREATEAVPARVVAKLRMEKKGRGGKTVTVVYGLPRNAEFLREFLAGGAKTKDSVMEAAEARGIGESAVKRAAFTVRVRYGSFGFPRKTTWELPS